MLTFKGTEKIQVTHYNSQKAPKFATKKKGI